MTKRPQAEVYIHTMEQNNGEIFTQGRRATSDLEKLSVWQGGSAQFFIHAPSGVSSVQLVIGSNAVDAEYDTEKRCWRVYCRPSLFAYAASYAYVVMALDEYGNTTILGKGTLVVKSLLSSVGSDDGVGYLSAVLGTFDYDSTKSQFTLSTDKLKYKDTGTETHSGDCLLKVDKDGYVSHDGNDSYNALYDLKANHFDSTSKANEGKGEIALKYTALALKADETLDANATKAVVFKGASLAATSGKAELADVAVLAPKSGEKDAKADNAPVADSAVGENEAAAAKIARIGTSSYAARADHVHPVCTDMGKATEETMTNGDSVSGVSAVSLDKTMWNIGGDNGVCDSYCSRVVISGTYRFFIFRERKFSKAGCLIYRGPEYVAFRAKHA